MYKQKAKISKNKILKGSRGITLIALVITIIILLILAGISIATLTGQNGLLTRASDAVNKSKEAEEKEQIGLAYNGVMTENRGTGVTESQLQTELQKYDNGIIVTEDQENNNFKVTFPSGNEYIVESNGIITGPTNSQVDNHSPSEAGKLAKGVLKINPNANSEVKDYERTPYVKYNNIICRVLYNDESHGLQLISSNPMEEEIKLGTGDDMVSYEDFQYSGSISVTNDFRKAAASYNRAVTTLNEKAKDYMSDDDKDPMTSNKIAIDARCLGSIATLGEDGKFEKENVNETTYKNSLSEFASFNNKFHDTDSFFTDDLGTEEEKGQLYKLGIDTSNDSSWVASRYIKFSDSEVSFYLRELTFMR